MDVMSGQKVCRFYLFFYGECMSRVVEQVLSLVQERLGGVWFLLKEECNCRVRLQGVMRICGIFKMSNNFVQLKLLFQFCWFLKIKVFVFLFDVLIVLIYILIC